MEKVNRVYFSLGSNLGDKKKNLNDAIEFLNEQISITKISSIYETPPLGFESNDFFLNLCLEAKVKFNPFELLEFTQSVEKKIGRLKKSISNQYSSRVIDIDIIFFDQLIMDNENLVLPHKYFRDRKFVLYPLQEIGSELIDPLTQKPISQLIKECTDQSEINILNQ